MVGVHSWNFYWSPGQFAFSKPQASPAPFYFYYAEDKCVSRHSVCLAPDCLDTELSVFMQRLRVQGVGGEPELA